MASKDPTDGITEPPCIDWGLQRFDEEFIRVIDRHCRVRYFMSTLTRKAKPQSREPNKEKVCQTFRQENKPTIRKVLQFFFSLFGAPAPPQICRSQGREASNTKIPRQSQGPRNNHAPRNPPWGQREQIKKFPSGQAE